MTADYKSTVFLPRTDFPMRAGLPKREPEWLERWARIGLSAKLREAGRGRERFILHDGPPYANGNIHIGHALNKILKDIINRSQRMGGKDVVYVPGWDCHGLPIEWQIEEQYRAGGKDKDAVPVVQFRQECRDFAAKWIEIQKEEFKRLGIEGDWDHPYTTMAHNSEAQIVRELCKFLMSESLYKGVKPVMWSVVEKTALAEAEVEYQDHKSTTVWVRFPVVETGLAALKDASVVIWTTTPWTLPGNRAVAFGAGFDYQVITVTETAPDSLAKAGEKLVVMTDLVAATVESAGIEGHDVSATIKGADLEGTVCAHPLRGCDPDGHYDFDVPLLPGHHVTAEDGTGFVHIAPGHGADDFEIGQKFSIETPETVGPGGVYYDHVALFAGTHVFKADGPVCEALAGAGNLLGQGSLVHSYPHSWRSKAPLIFRATPQWFISMSENGLRDKALAAIQDTRWVPPAGKNRILSMVESRPDWCISRQRAWGVPITVFVDKRSGKPLRDEAVNERIIQAVEAEGTDVWFTAAPEKFLGPDHDAKDFDQVTDILDVWFDSGASHAFVLEQRDDLAWPAALYLEGSDQHRGWFQSSLLESCGTRGRAPYDAVLTHGFVMDGAGRKMSKSLGNVVAPQKVVDEFGADVLRLWVVGSDYSEDLRIGPDIIKHQTDTYRRLRNTMRYLLGAVADFDPSARLAADEMPELERWVLHRLHELDRMVRDCCGAYDFHPLYTAIHNFCAVDLSAFYFDIRKDALYCDRRDSIRRRAALTVMDHVFMCLTTWLAPVLCFTAEEVWLSRFPSDDDSVHLQTFPDVPEDWRDDALAAKWDRIRRLRRAVTGAIEIKRADGTIGSSLQAHPVVHVEATDVEAMDGVDLAEISITSAATLVQGAGPDDAFSIPEIPGIAVVVDIAQGEKCQRCWQVLIEVGDGGKDICRRCADAVASLADAG